MGGYRITHRKMGEVRPGEELVGRRRERRATLAGFTASQSCEDDGCELRGARTVSVGG